MHVRRRHISVAISSLLAIAMLASAQIALAVFNKTVVGGPLTVASSTLSSATGVNASQVNCRINKNPEIEVSWTATSSTYASSYTVERATANTGPYTALASVPIVETSYIDKGVLLGYSTTYYYRITTVYDSWSATSTVASVRTLNKVCVAL
jgi:hypothetical protein